MFPLLLIYGDWSIFILRLILGTILVVHGWPKIKDIKGTSTWFNSAGFKPGHIWAPIVAVVEFFGGLFLILGILVQPVALLLTIQFLVILIWKISAKQKFVGNLELDLILFTGILVALTVETNINLLNMFYWLGILK
ncbi:MAG: DoxX family protein [Patescibacteria group bacterium]